MAEKKKKLSPSPRARWFAAGLAVVVLLALLAGVVAAQSSGRYDLSWYSLNSGAGTTAGSQHALVGTLGETLPGGARGDAFEMDGGYLPGRAPYQTYLPVVLRRHW